MYPTHDKEDNGGTEGTSSQYHGCQMLPTNITPTPTDLANQGTTGGNREVLPDSNHRIPLQEICNTGYPTQHQSFDHFRSLEDIDQRIIQLSQTTGVIIGRSERKQLAKLWIMCKDDQFIITISKQARDVYNWQCADLIETFANIANIEWMAPIHPSGSIEQFGLDLLQCTLAADVEHFYETAIDDIHHNQYGVIPQTNNPMDQLFIKHSHCAMPIIPDWSHITELIDDTQTLTRELANHINNACTIIDMMKQTTKWTCSLYPNGTKPQRFC